MELYICSNCKNVIGNEDDFSVVTPNFMMSRSLKQIEKESLETEYQTKCPSCNSYCEFSKKYVYEEPIRGFGERKAKIIFKSNTVIRYRDMVKSMSKKQQKNLKIKVQEFEQKKWEKIEREEQNKIKEQDKKIERLKNQRQKESDEYWERVISKYPLFGISNWLFGKKKISSKQKEEINKSEKKTTPKPKKVEKKKSNFGKQYHDLEKTLLAEDSSWVEEYRFIKSLREKLKIGEVDLEDISSYIKKHHKKYDGAEIMTKTELYNQLEHVFTVYLEEWEKKKETNFVGFKDVEQYHSLSQKIVIELGDLLQEKIMELGK
jgi:hypothetical protein